MKIVVTTPNGHVGSRVVRLLLQAGARPTLLLRDAAKLDGATRERVDIVQGSQSDVEVVLRATEGADALFWVNPRTTEDDPIATWTHMGANAARAVKDNGVARTVFQSSLGAEKRSGAGEIDGLARTEQQLDQTGASVLHLRCGYFFTNLLEEPDALRDGVLRTAMPIDRPMPWVDPRDIGDIVAARLLSTVWSGRHVQGVHGPHDLTFIQVATIVSHATGRQVRAEHVSDDDLRGTLRSAGLSDKQTEGIIGMSSGLRENFTPEDPRSILTTTPTSLTAWAHENLRLKL